MNNDRGSEGVGASVRSGGLKFMALNRKNCALSVVCALNVCLGASIREGKKKKQRQQRSQHCSRAIIYAHIELNRTPLSLSFLSTFSFCALEVLCIYICWAIRVNFMFSSRWVSLVRFLASISNEISSWEICIFLVLIASLIFSWIYLALLWKIFWNCLTCYFFSVTGNS